MKHLFKVFLAGALLAFSGCNNAQTKSSEGIKDIKFSTKGKPTKTLVTPNGSQEVYDPTQDPEIRKLFREIYDHNRNPDNADVKYDYRRAGPIFTKAQAIQQNDLLRAGCVSLIVPVTTGVSTGPPKQFPVCEKVNWGSASFSACEKKNIDLNLIVQTIECVTPCISDLNGNPVPSINSYDQIGPKSPQMPYDSYEGQLDGYFKAECRHYFK